MAKKEENSSNWWKWGFYILLAFVVFAVLAGNDSSNNYQNSDNGDYYLEDISDSKGIYTVTLSGTNDKTTVHRPNDKVILTVSGLNIYVTVTRQTEISQITLSGTNNVINFCSGGYPIPEFSKTGLNNEINIVDC